MQKLIDWLLPWVGLARCRAQLDNLEMRAAKLSIEHLQLEAEHRHLLSQYNMVCTKLDDARLELQTIKHKPRDPKTGRFIPRRTA